MGFISFGKNITASATPEALSTTYKRISSGVIQAKKTNTGTIHIGQRGVIDNTGNTGSVLAAGEPYNLTLSGVGGQYDLSQIFIAASVNGEGVTFSGFGDDLA
jgi:hypothetical protein